MIPAPPQASVISLLAFCSVVDGTMSAIAELLGVGPRKSGSGDPLLSHATLVAWSDSNRLTGCSGLVVLAHWEGEIGGTMACPPGVVYLPGSLDCVDGGAPCPWREACSLLPCSLLPLSRVRADRKNESDPPAPQM